MATSAIHLMHPYTAEAGSSAAANDPGASTISANDFLTLLVTEMQNQDPTAATDPNEYINQLVNVNSLQQLISINQTLTTDASSAAPSTAPPTSARADAVSAGRAHHSAGAGIAASAGAAMAAVAGAQTLAARTTQGNMNLPMASPSAESIARALAKH